MTKIVYIFSVYRVKGSGWTVRESIIGDQSERERERERERGERRLRK